MNLVEIDSLRCGYAGRGTVFSGVDLIVRPGDRIGLVGHTGSGKTTLLKALVGLVRPESGEIRVQGRACASETDFALARRSLGYLFQNPDDQLFCPTLIEDVAFGPLNLGATADQARRTAEACLGQVGLADLAERAPRRLSGGEKQLACLAGVLAMRPKVLLLDEPASGLDPQSRRRLMDLLNGLDLAVLAVSHDWDFLAAITSVRYELTNGSLRRASDAAHVHVHVHTLGGYPHGHG